MDLVFQPIIGASPLLFGQRREEVRTILLNMDPDNNPSEKRVDKYPGGLILDYDKDNRLIYIEVFEPSSAVMNGIEFFVDDLDEVVDRLRALDSRFQKESGAYFAPSIGLALFVPRDQIESVSLYVPGYYSSECPDRTN